MKVIKPLDPPQTLNIYNLSITCKAKNININLQVCKLLQIIKRYLYNTANIFVEL